MWELDTKCYSDYSFTEKNGIKYGKSYLIKVKLQKAAKRDLLHTKKCSKHTKRGGIKWHRPGTYLVR